MVSKPTQEGQKQICPDCKADGRDIEIHAENKPYQGQDRLSWRNPDGSSHAKKTAQGDFVHVGSDEEGKAAYYGGSATGRPVAEKAKTSYNTKWPDLPELSDTQQALYAADDLIEAIAVDKARTACPELETGNPGLFGQIVSAKSHRIALVNLAKAIKDGAN